MYKIFVRYNYEDIIKGYYNTLAEAKAAYGEYTGTAYPEHPEFGIYYRQGYTGKYWDPTLGPKSDPNAWVKVDGDEIRTNEEWVYTVSRIPFVGRTGDPGTGEVSYTPTGMTDTIEIHLELRSRAAINDWQIPTPVNYTKLHASKFGPIIQPDPLAPVICEVQNFITVFVGSGRFNYKLVSSDNNEMKYESVIACDAPQFVYRTWESNSLDNFEVKDASGTSYYAVIYRSTVSNVPDNYTKLHIVTISASVEPTDSGIVIGIGTYRKGASCTLTAIPATGYSFVNWTAPGMEPVTDNPYTFIVDESGSYTANFTDAPEE